MSVDGPVNESTEDAAECLASGGWQWSIPVAIVQTKGDKGLPHSPSWGVLGKTAMGSSGASGTW